MRLTECQFRCCWVCCYAMTPPFFSLSVVDDDVTNGSLVVTPHLPTIHTTCCVCTWSARAFIDHLFLYQVVRCPRFSFPIRFVILPRQFKTTNGNTSSTIQLIWRYALFLISFSKTIEMFTCVQSRFWRALYLTFLNFTLTLRWFWHFCFLKLQIEILFFFNSIRWWNERLVLIVEKHVVQKCTL